MSELKKGKPKEISEENESLKTNKKSADDTLNAEKKETNKSTNKKKSGKVTSDSEKEEEQEQWTQHFPAETG